MGRARRLWGYGARVESLRPPARFGKPAASFARGSGLTQAIGADKQTPTSNEDHLDLQFNQRA
jgi:hypothetical protein